MSGSRTRRARLARPIGVALALCAASGPARADDAVSVALAPLSTLGVESQSKETRAIRSRLADAIQAVPGAALTDERDMLRAIRRARKPGLRTCDGDDRCLATLGALLGVDYVIFGEVGGLGDAQVVYLKLVATGDRKELRSTTLERDDPASARAAAYKLLAPERYVGRLRVQVDTDGAAIYVDGQRQANSPAPPIAVSVGAHALRVSHPEFRDFVRFVDVAFDDEQAIEVNLQKYPIIDSDIDALPGDGTPGEGGVIYRGAEPTPWYRRWYAVAGFTTAVLVGSAVAVGLIVNGIDADRERVVGDGVQLGAPTLRW